LLSKAIPDGKNDGPLQTSPKEWTFRDIMRMPEAQKKE